MKREQLQHDLLVRLVKCFVVFGVLGIGVYALRFYVHKQDEKYNLLTSDVMSLSRKLEGLNRKTLEFSDAVRTWEGLTDGQKQLRGLQLTEARALLEKWQTQFKLSEVNTSFSKPEELSMSNEKNTGKVGNKEDRKATSSTEASVRVMSSEVTITLKALSDEYVYDFIDALEHQFPGYVRIKTFVLNKEMPISKQVIQRIAQGEDIPVVSGSIDFSWRDLQYIPTTAPDREPPKEGSSL